MSDVPAVYSGLRIQLAASGSIPRVYTIAAVGSRRENLQRRPLLLAAWSRYAHTQTYDERGRLVESPAPPTFDIRM